MYKRYNGVCVQIFKHAGGAKSENRLFTVLRANITAPTTFSNSSPKNPSHTRIYKAQAATAKTMDRAKAATLVLVMEPALEEAAGDEAAPGAPAPAPEPEPEEPLPGALGEVEPECVRFPLFDDVELEKGEVELEVE